MSEPFDDDNLKHQEPVSPVSAWQEHNDAAGIVSTREEIADARIENSMIGYTSVAIAVFRWKEFIGLKKLQQAHTCSDGKIRWSDVPSVPHDAPDEQ